VLRLSAAGMSKRQIAASLGVNATAAGECLRRARRVGLTWPLPEGRTDEALEVRLYRRTITVKDHRPRPDGAVIHRQLRRAGVTLQLLWEEHRAAFPDGYGYCRFCKFYRAWKARPSPTMDTERVITIMLAEEY
jgi:transposase